MLFPTVGLYVMSFDGLNPALAAAICRAYKNWPYDFCQHAPELLQLGCPDLGNETKSVLLTAVLHRRGGGARPEAGGGANRQ
jgi:hypothetical protein